LSSSTKKGQNDRKKKYLLKEKNFICVKQNNDFILLSFTSISMNHCSWDGLHNASQAMEEAIHRIAAEIQH
jgi:hypothetical protein